MAANAIEWPIALSPWTVHFRPQNQSRSGGLSLVGDEQVTVSPAGRWTAQVTLAIRGEAANLALGAFVAEMEGRAGTVMVPRWGRYGPRDFQGRTFSPVGGIGYGDHGCGDLNFDLSGFGQQDIAFALTGAPASVRSSQLQMHVLSGQGPRPGNYFGIGSRAYRVTKAWSADEDDNLNVQFFPLLRTAVPAGARVILDRPVCLMRFASDTEGVEALSKAGSGRVVLSFEEVPPAASEVEPVWAGDVVDIEIPPAQEYVPTYHILGF